MTETGWEEVTAVHPIHLQPCYLSSKENLEEGVHRYLCTYLYKYDPVLKCIPVAFSRVDWSMAGGVGQVLGDSPRVHFNVRVRWTAFTPQSGLEVEGTVINLDVTGLLINLINDEEAHLKALVMAADLKEEWI